MTIFNCYSPAGVQYFDTLPRTSARRKVKPNEVKPFSPRPNRRTTFRRPVKKEMISSPSDFIHTGHWDRSQPIDVSTLLHKV